MFLTGYQPQDLVRSPAFHAEAMGAVEALAAACADGPALGIGAPWVEGAGLYNAYFILQGGRIAARMLKHDLPNEDVFDEKRIFDPRPDLRPLPDRPAAPRHAGLRGRLARDRGRDAGRNRGRGAVRPQRLALSPRQARPPDERHGGARGRDRAAAGLSQHRRRPGRSGLRRRPASCSIPAASWRCSLPPFEEVVAHVDLEETPEGWRVAARRRRSRCPTTGSRTITRWC